MSTFNVFVDETKNTVIVNEDSQKIIIKDVGVQGPAGPAGANGADGADGVGIPTGGTTGQYLRKKSSTDFDTEFATISLDEVTEGSTNKFFTDEKVDDRVAALLVAGSNVNLNYNDAANTLTISSSVITDHTLLTNIGTNTHAQIDSHISNTSNPHSVTKSQIGLSNVDDVQQMPMSYLDTDGTLSANSDLKIASQKAAKTYSDSKVSDDAYNSATWDSVTTSAPSKNAVRDKIETLMPISGGTFTGAVIESVVSLTDAATISVDATLGNIFTVTLGGNRTLGNPTGAVNGQKMVFRIRQDVTGSRTITLDTKYRLGSDITTVSLSTSANKTDYLGVIYHSSDDKFDVVAFVKGY